MLPLTVVILCIRPQLQCHFLLGQELRQCYVCGLGVFSQAYAGPLTGWSKSHIVNSVTAGQWLR